MSEATFGGGEGEMIDDVSRIRVWWIPQIPGKPFFYPVPTIEAGVTLCDALAKYDLFQLESQIKPDYSNVGGIEILDRDGDWLGFDPDDEYDMECAREILGEVSA